MVSSLIDYFVDKNFSKLVFIGTLAGMIASFIGSGSEIIIVPLLIYLKVFSDYKMAVGTSLASLLLPIGIVAVYFYSTAKNCNSCIKWNYALTISVFFVIGSFLSYFTVKMNTRLFKIFFAMFIILLGVVMLLEEHLS
jgi:uncharacterized membrane protein YfcA